MTKAGLWQFNAFCSLILLIATVGIFWSWRGVMGVGHAAQDLDAVPLVKKSAFIIPEKIMLATSTISVEPASTTEDKSVEVKKELPKKINLDVPFTSQAPEKNWEQPWQDACEEAAILMLAAYYKDMTLSPLFAKDEILKMIEWEEERGWGNSIEIEKIKDLMGGFIADKFQISNFKFQIKENASVEEIKQYIANGHPVYVVADGKVLPNPHFRNGGPEYHALIIRGYTEDSFITNDPGTQFGKNYVYQYDELMNAIRDWNDGDVKNGRKVILVME